MHRQARQHGDAAAVHAYPTPRRSPRAEPEELEEIIRTTGFFRNKAKSLIGMARRSSSSTAARCRTRWTLLVKLPGVGRKTANVVLGNAFGKNEGVVVDTHVARLSQRLGLTKETDPVKIEQDLMQLFPREDWTMLAHLLIFHGRRSLRGPSAQVRDLHAQRHLPIQHE